MRGIWGVELSTPKKIFGAVWTNSLSWGRDICTGLPCVPLASYKVNVSARLIRSPRITRCLMWLLASVWIGWHHTLGRERSWLRPQIVPILSTTSSIWIQFLPTQSMGWLYWRRVLHQTLNGSRLISITVSVTYQVIVGSGGLATLLKIFLVDEIPMITKGESVLYKYMVGSDAMLLE